MFLSNQPPYGYDPQNPSGGYPPQQPGSGYPPSGYPPSGYPPQQSEGQYPGYPPQGAYPPPPGGQYPPQGGYPQQQYAYDPYAQPGYPVAQPEKGGGFAIAGLILGIISIPIAVIAICGYATAIAGFIFSLLGRRAPSKRTMATIGLVLSIIGFLASIASSVVGFALLNSQQ